jgi:uncharacterized protein YbjT (DUF2867 family)
MEAVEMVVRDLSKRALVIGATGYTGQAVVRELSRRGINTWAHVRPDSSRLEEWKEEFGALEGVTVTTAAWNNGPIRQALNKIQPTHIFLQLGTTKKREKEGTSSAVADNYEAVDYGLTHMVIEEAKNASVSPRILYLSSIGAKENTSNDYLRARGRIEAELAASDLSWVAVRASFISGQDREDSRPMERVGAVLTGSALKLARMVGARSLDERYQPRSSSDVARLLVDFAFDEKQQGVAYFDDIEVGSD